MRRVTQSMQSSPVGPRHAGCRDEDDRRWLLEELADCVDSWRGAIETAGHGSYAAVSWEGRADQALRTALHFGLLDPDEGRQQILSVDANASGVRALAEPDGEA